jgi:hypothetical protein
MRGDCKGWMSALFGSGGLRSNATGTQIGAELTGNLNLMAIAGSFDSQAVKQTR